MARIGSSRCSMMCDMWMRVNWLSSSGQGYWSRFQTLSAAEPGDMSIPTAPGSILRLPHPMSRTILNNVAHRRRAPDRRFAVGSAWHSPQLRGRTFLLDLLDYDNVAISGS